MSTAAEVKAAFFSSTPTACKSRNWRCGQREGDKAWTLFYRRSGQDEPEVQVALRWGPKYGFMATSNSAFIPYRLWLQVRRRFNEFADATGADLYYRSTDGYLLDDVSYGAVVKGLKATAAHLSGMQWRTYASSGAAATYSVDTETSLAS